MLFRSGLFRLGVTFALLRLLRRCSPRLLPSFTHKSVTAVGGGSLKKPPVQSSGTIDLRAEGRLVSLNPSTSLVVGS